MSRIEREKRVVDQAQKPIEYKKLKEFYVLREKGDEPRNVIVGRKKGKAIINAQRQDKSV